MNKMISLATSNIAKEAKCFIDNHRRYAARHGYEYECHTDTLWPDHPFEFAKVPAIKRALDPEYEYVVWVDADIAFLKSDWDVKSIVVNQLAANPELFMTALQQANFQRWKYLCTGIMVFRNTPYTHSFMEQWVDYCLNGVPNVDTAPPGTKVIMRDKPHEQYCLDQLVRDTRYKGIYAASHKEIGCFCPTTWHDGVLYEPGMPTMHFATGPWDRRAQIFRTKYAQLVC